MNYIIIIISYLPHLPLALGKVLMFSGPGTIPMLIL